MQKIIITIIFSTCLFVADAQKEDYTWVLGYDKDFFEPSPTILGLMEISFDNNTIEITENEVGLMMDLTVANICDKNGEMLFYTNGMEIAGSDHEIIENGTGINSGRASDDWTLLGKPMGYRIQQSAIILPDPGKQDEYYTFHLWTKGITNFTLLGTVEKLLYTKVKVDSLMNKTVVTEKNVEIHEEQSFFYGHLTAVRHGNGRDWWLITKGHENNKYISFLISPEGISEPFIQNIGIASKEDAFEGQAVFSPIGDKYFHFSGADGVFVMDYDRCSGVFSNFQQISSPKPDDVNGRGMAISPNGRFIYLSFAGEIYQLDLDASDISASSILIDTWDTIDPPIGFWATFNQMQLAPNGEIFMSATNTTGYLHVIKHPNKKGLDCNFRQRGLELPSCNNFGLPNFPNFRLFDLANSLCDTLGIDSMDTSPNEGSFENFDCKIYPNPSTGLINVEFQSPSETNMLLVVYDISGRIVEQFQLPKYTYRHVLSLEKGIYFYSVFSEDWVVKNGKLVVIE